jgi:Zn-dependent alcohol dehydrogenase
MGAARIIAMSGHPPRQKLAREFGATDIVTERGEEGVERIMQLTNGVGADAVLECVGTQQSMMQAIHSTRPGGPRWLCRRSSWRRAQWRGAVLRACSRTVGFLGLTPRIGR